MLEIKNLTVNLAGKQILNRLSLTFDAGDIAVLMGPNGSGKTTLARAVMGLVDYSGDIKYSSPNPASANNLPSNPSSTHDNLDNLSPGQRSQKGIFLSFQDPPAISGLTVSDFLRTITSEDLSLADFYASLQKNLELVGLPADYADRELNVGFSGGEKKKMEMLQLLMLNPSLAIFDEIDSGLDVDTVRAVAKAIKKWHSPEKTALIITHNSRLIKRLKPNKVFILKSGRIAQAGSFALAEQILEKGFSE